MYASTSPSSRTGRLIMTIVYLIAAAVVLCGCLFFFIRKRNRSRD
jgi:hypothetical protein